MVLCSRIQWFRTSPGKRRKIGRLQWKQRALVDGLIEEPVAGNPFQFQRTQESSPWSIIKSICAIFENVLVGGYTRVALVTFQEIQTWDFTQPLFQAGHVRLPLLRLLGKAFKLSFQNCRLEFCYPVIKTDQPLAKLVGR